MKQTMKFRLTLAVLSTCSLAVGCGGSSGGGGLSSSGNIVGLWDSSEDYDGVVDVMYFSISQDEVVSYDYAGDDFDQGENCFIIDRSSLDSLGGGQYSVDGDDDNPVQLTLIDGRLRVSYIDTEDEDEDGDTEETIVETFSRVEGISEVDLNECV